MEPFGGNLWHCAAVTFAGFVVDDPVVIKNLFCQDIQTVTVCKQNSQFPMTTHTIQSFF